MCKGCKQAWVCAECAGACSKQPDVVHVGPRVAGHVTPWPRVGVDSHDAYARGSNKGLSLQRRKGVYQHYTVSMLFSSRPQGARDWHCGAVGGVPRQDRSWVPRHGEHNRNVRNAARRYHRTVTRHRRTQHKVLFRIHSGTMVSAPTSTRRILLMFQECMIPAAACGWAQVRGVCHIAHCSATVQTTESLQASVCSCASAASDSW